MNSQTIIRILNGPNLNLLGTREPEIYGSDTLDDVRAHCEVIAKDANVQIEFFQSNHEGQIVDWIQESIGHADGLIINPAAFTHTSVALHDALKMYDGIAVEVHISNPHAREEFRHHSFVSSVVDAVIAGMGVRGYEIAMHFVLAQLRT